jgi:hypothetical protein
MDRKDIRNLEITFNQTSKEATRTYDILNGMSGRSGAERVYLIAKKAAEKNPNNKKLAERLSKAKLNYETATANYKKAQDAKNAARKKLNAALGTTEKQKDAQSSVDKYNKAVEKVKDAEAIIDSRGQAQYDAAVQTAYQLGEEAKAAGGKIKPLPAPASGVTRPPAPSSVKSGDISKLSDAEQVEALMGSASITLNGSQYQVNVSSPNPLDPKGEPVVGPKYIYYEPGTKSKFTGTGRRPIPGTPSGTAFGDSDAVRDKYQKQLLEQYGSKQALIDKLFKGGFLPTNKFAANQMSKAIIEGLEDAVAEYTLKQVDDYKNNNVKEFETMDAFLTSGKRSDKSSLTRTTRTATVYDDTRATALIKRLYQTAQGRDPNEKELKELIPMVQDFQKKNPQISTSTKNEEGTSSSGVNRLGGDPEEFLVDKLSEKNETKARSILGYYDAFKSTIGVQ